MVVEMDFCSHLPFILDLILILILVLQTYLLTLLLVSLKFDSSSPVIISSRHSPPRCTLYHILNFLNYYHYYHVLNLNLLL